ncbi:MAG: hypothetical protein ABIE70_06260 [bacterium]
MKDNLGIDFLHRTLRTSGIVLLIFLPFGIYYLGFYSALAVFTGGVWGIVNFYLLAGLVLKIVRPQGPDTRSAIILSLIKFPLLYGAGYCLLASPLPGFTPGRLLAGFSIVMTVMVLKALSRVILKIDSPATNRNLQEAG